MGDRAVSAAGAPAAETFESADSVPALHGVLAKARSENFPVASWLLPPAHRGHLLALYAFARMVDDIGDEAAGDRLRLLDAVSGDIARLFAGAAPTTKLYADLAATVHERGLPKEPFDRLIEANRQDQSVCRYRTFDDLLGYCALSADPVGRLVLGVFGADTPDRRVLSDRICSALQVLEHCQDVAEDVRQGRIYLPLADLDLFGVTESDLFAERAGRPLRALIGYEVQRAVAMLDEGAPLVATLRGTARVAVAGYVAGGRATAVAIASARFDVLAGTPKPAKTRTAAEWLRLLGKGGDR
ncbi:squalene synthase HpnC [Prauserella marina]|uniref:squalene synthase HpnC n=1 Tax=Prauserella marina TaxID=530584 RepID=UPI000B8861D5|nr:squalene synthase HpnC [Prauserella marina]ASR35940.1 squalene synthase HpnC [Prauserella marina]